MNCRSSEHESDEIPNFSILRHSYCKGTEYISNPFTIYESEISGRIHTCLGSWTRELNFGTLQFHLKTVSTSNSTNGCGYRSSLSIYGKIFNLKKNHINKGENEHYCKSSCFIYELQSCLKIFHDYIDIPYLKFF